MPRLTSGQRALLADKLLDTANVTLGGLVVGQFVSGRDFSLAVFIAGVAIWGLVTAAGLVFAGGGQWSEPWRLAPALR